MKLLPTTQKKKKNVTKKGVGRVTYSERFNSTYSKLCIKLYLSLPEKFVIYQNIKLLQFCS